MSNLIGYVTLVALLWLPIGALIDVMLYRDPRIRKRLYEERAVKGKRSLFFAYLETNAAEVGLFLVGFWLASAFGVLGWIP